MFTFDREKYKKRVEWFQNARFGMFIHWGLYAIPARGEWVRGIERMTREQYVRYFEEFDPSACSPAAWAKAAKQAGMQYVILTAKHHDGFCLWDTATTDFKATKTRAGRDFVREYVDAVRAEGLKVGLYYSIIDWDHPDFPHYGDRHHPMRDDPAFGNDDRDFGRYLTYMHRQVEELCTGYGKIDILWFDFSYDEMRGEKWEATRLMEMVRRHQPDVIVNNRLEVSGEGYGSLAEGKPTAYHGDLVTPEKIVPPGGIVDVNGEPMVWESCLTMNDNWGYSATDRFFKPAPMLLHSLVECVSKGGNLLLNVGPDAEGRIPEASMDILREMGRWMALNGESIYGCGPAGVEKPEYGRLTRRGDDIFVHVYDNTVGPLPLFGIPKERIDSVRRLADGTEVPLSTSWVHSDYPHLAFVDLGPDPVLPDPVDTVLKVRLKPE